MAALIFIFIVICSMGDVVIKNTFAKGEVCTDGDNHIFNAIACIIGAPLALVIHGLSSLSLESFALGAGYGFCMAFVAIYGVKSFKTGSMSLTSMFGSFSMIIPIIVGFAFFHESITAMKVTGIIAMFIAVYFIISPSNDGAVSKEWIINVLIYFLSTGLMSMFQQIAAKDIPEETASFLVTGYCTATFFICLNLPYLNRNQEKKVSKKFISRENFNGLLVGIIGALNSIASMKVLGMIESTIFYPIKVGVCLTCNALLGYFMFHERLGKKQIAGFVIGTVSVIVLTIF